jgi:hypothetical protein
MAFGAIDGGSNPPGTTQNLYIIPSDQLGLSGAETVLPTATSDRKTARLRPEITGTHPLGDRTEPAVVHCIEGLEYVPITTSTFADTRATAPVGVGGGAFDRTTHVGFKEGSR